ncbi:hypothetical protein L596_003770 [Steinernema carpocapsae]|uniref:Uncharacterized protein n=1 Tax=Steinernema carpocapsae TaxID=34508 RepID=A0A4U8UUP9_STECR|nr:hypothetical protein L596_003770 [Steinernema carpocapsae]
MDTNCIFRLTRTSLHQIPDLSDYFKLDFAPRAKEMPSESSPKLSPRNDVASALRLSRSSSKTFTTSSNRMSNTRHHSLIAMRTHYAYGARSASLSSSTSGINYSNNYSSSTSKFTPSESFSRSLKESLEGRYGSTSYRNLMYVPSTYTSSAKYGKKTNYGSYGYSSRRLSYSSSNTYISSSSYSATTPLSVQTQRTRLASPTYRSHRLSPTFSERLTIPVPSAETCPVSPKASPVKVRTPVYVEASVQTEVCETEENQESASGNDQKKEEVGLLKAENESLKKEMEKLKNELKAKERLENEAKRKQLDAEAELKVWKAKYELLQPKILQTRDLSHDILPLDLIDQLDSAADRLKKLNAVKDLKLLQKEMESALLEIAHK